MPIPTTGAGTTGTAGLTDIFMDSRSQTDADALAYIAAAGLTDSTQVQAAHALIGGLKGLGLWAKMLALYPFIGGSAVAHAVNAKSPGAFNITWMGGAGAVTHNGNGVAGNGSTGYGLTGLTPANLSTSHHICIYSRTSGVVSAYDVSSEEGSRNSNGLIARWSDGVYFYPSLLARFVNDGLGVFVGNRLNGVDSLRKRGAVLYSASTLGGLYSSHQFALLARWQNNTTASSFSSRNLSFCSIGSGLTNSEAVAFSALVQHVQGILGRAV